MPLDLDYIGVDIVAELDARATRSGSAARARGGASCASTSPPTRLPRADVVFCRDCLVHLSFDHIRQAFENLRRSGSTWLLTTTFLDHHENADIESGDWRILNLTRPPFNLPTPEGVLVEGCLESDGAYADKALGLWRIADLHLMTYVNHRDTEDTEDAQRPFIGGQRSSTRISPQRRSLCVSVFSVSLWLTYVIRVGASASRRRRRRSR